jgi:hypothetical protein
MGIEREQTWARMVEHYPSFAELQTKPVARSRLWR